MSFRLKWTMEEEEMLRNLGASDKKNKWTIIAKLINEKSPSFNRTPKQCREKFNNHLIFCDFGQNNNWTTQDDEILFKEYKQNGPKWKVISKKFPTKSQNTIKNKFYGNIRKIVRRLNKIGKENIKKSFKPIRQKSIIRIIEPEIELTEVPQKAIINIKSLRLRLLDMIEKGIHETEQENTHNLASIIELIKEIHNFNSNFRFYLNKKVRKVANPDHVGLENHQTQATETAQQNQLNPSLGTNQNELSLSQQSQFDELQETDKKLGEENKENIITSMPQKSQQSFRAQTPNTVINEQGKSNFLTLFSQLVFEFCQEHNRSYLSLFQRKF